MSQKRVLVNSPAKLNLFLEVLSRRSDGFHELETVMVRTDLHDVVTASRSQSSWEGQSRLTVSGSPELIRDLPLDASNLILKAADAFFDAASIDLNWQIHLLKRIPMEAGLAGGSSNAAATLLGLNRLAKDALPTSRLHQIAASLGSDINFFLEECSAARCTGRGEVVSPLPVSGPLWFAIARPRSGNSTPAVFKNLTLPDEARSSASLVESLKCGDFDGLQSSLFNRLTTSALELNSQMGHMLKTMTQVAGRQAHMSGSGSTCFVLCREPGEADHICKAIQCDATFCQSAKLV